MHQCTHTWGFLSAEGHKSYVWTENIEIPRYLCRDKALKYLKSPLNLERLWCHLWLGLTVMSSVSGLYTFTINAAGSSKLTRHARTPSSGNLLFLTRISRATGCFCSNSRKTTYTTSWCPHVAMQHEVENSRTWEVELKFWTAVYFFQGAKLFVSSQQLVFGQSLKIQATFPLKSSTVSVVCWPIVKRTANLLLLSAAQKSTL